MALILKYTMAQVILFRRSMGIEKILGKNYYLFQMQYYQNYQLKYLKRKKSLKEKYRD